MNIILYLFVQNKCEMPLLERGGGLTYGLVRVGLSQLWLKKISETCQKIDTLTVADQWYFVRRRRERKEKRFLVTFLETQMQELTELVRPLVDNPNECEYVLEQRLWGHPFSKLWQGFSPYVAFRRETLRKAPWVEELMGRITLPDLIILGMSQDLLRPLWRRIARLRSVQWYVTSRDFTEDLQEYLEALACEYGLAVDLRILSLKDSYENVIYQSRVPVEILDFSEAKRLKVFSLAKGSKLLDMGSSLEKQKFLETKVRTISYDSMEKIWSQRQKEAPYLDTKHKNGYNTLVNRGVLDVQQSEDNDDKSSMII